MSIRSICKSYNPYAKGYYADQAGRIAVREFSSRLYVWLVPGAIPGMWCEVGTTLTAEDGTFVPFD